MSIALVTDSTCDLSSDVLTALDVQIVPLYIHFQEVQYKQEVDLDTETFFQKQALAEELPHTSQPSPADFVRLYTDLFEKGFETVISLHISADLSGTVQSAKLAKAEFPDRDIRVIDSRTVSIGLGKLVTEADESTSGPASLTLMDPDGNPILLDQHVE